MKKHIMWLVLLAVSAQAATITFSGRSPVTNAGAVLTNGSYVVAGNIHGASDPVVQGVTFQKMDFTTPITDNGVTLLTYDLGGTSGYTFSDAQSYYSADADLAELMAKSFLGAYYSGGIGITMSNLTVGVKYQLQGFYWDKASGSIQYVRNASNVTNRSETFHTSASPTGYCWTATWVADSTVQSIEVVPGPSSRALISGMSLRAMGVPEFGAPVSVPDDSGSVFLNSRTYVFGVNVGNSGSEIHTVNGVKFLSGGVDGGTQTLTANNVTVTITTDNGQISGQAAGVYTDTGSADEIFDVMDTGYISASAGSIIIQFSGLTSNRTYRLQTFHMINTGNETYRQMRYAVNDRFFSSYFHAFYDGAAFTSAVANVVTFTADGTTQTIALQARGGGRAYLSALSLYDLDGFSDPYLTWLYQYPEIGSATNRMDNPDGDSLNNLCEWALGGDPTDAGDIGLVPGFELLENGDTNYFQYVYPQRSDAVALGLSYYLEWSDNLVSTPWINQNVEISGTNVTGGAFDYVTNRVSLDAASAQFLKLVIESN